MKGVPLVAALASLGIGAAGAIKAEPAPEWSVAEIEILRSLSLSSLPPLRPDPTNKYSEDPRAADFGHRLFSPVRVAMGPRNRLPRKGPRA